MSRNANFLFVQLVLVLVTLQLFCAEVTPFASITITSYGMIDILT